jgi:hypothetical protein
LAGENFSIILALQNLLIQPYRNKIFVMKSLQLLIFILITKALYCQIPGSTEYSHNTGSLHQIHQIETTRQDLSDFFIRSGISFKNEVVYAVTLPPMTCSRCEGIINPFISYLKKKDQEAEAGIISVYDKPKALHKYLEKRQFSADWFITSADDQFTSLFHFSGGSLQVPFIVKFNIRTGDLIAGYSTLGMEMNSEMVDEIYFVTEPQAKISRRSQDKAESGFFSEFLLKSIHDTLPVLKPVVEIRLPTNDDYPNFSIVIS